MLAFGMAVKVVSQIAGLATTFQLMGEVLELTADLVAMGNRVEVNACMTQKALKKIATMVAQNA